MPHTRLRVVAALGLLCCASLGAQSPPRDNSAVPNSAATGKIRGRVVAADTGSPLPRAQVRVISGQPRVQLMATTGDDGNYEISNLPAGRYAIDVSRSGYVNLQYGQRRAFEPGRPLVLGAGEVADKIDFALPRGGVIAGKVTDQYGEPVAGVRIMAQRYVYQPGGQRTLVPGTQGSVNPFGFISDDLGQFRVYGLMPGAYVLSAQPGPTTQFVPMNPAAGPGAAELNSVNTGFAITFYPGTADAAEAQPVVVGLGQEAPAYFSLVSARLSRVSGFVRNSQGRAVQGAFVSVRTLMLGALGTNGGTVTSADGSFTIPGVSPGDHFLDVRQQARPTNPPDTLEEFASVPISVHGENISGLVITTGPGAVLSGRLVFDGTSARPPVGQQLRVFSSPAYPGEGGGVFVTGVSNPNNGVVDDSGRFQLTGMNGQIVLRSNAPGWGLSAVMLNGVDVTDVPIDARPGTNITGIEIVLTDKQTNLSGVVKNARGEGQTDFVVVALPSNLREGMIPTRFTRTSRPAENGKYQFRGLPPGGYVVFAVESLEQGDEWDPAFQDAMKPKGTPVTLVEGQPVTLDLPLIQ